MNLLSACLSLSLSLALSIFAISLVLLFFGAAGFEELRWAHVWASARGRYRGIVCVRLTIDKNKPWICRLNITTPRWKKMWFSFLFFFFFVLFFFVYNLFLKPPKYQICLPRWSSASVGFLLPHQCSSLYSMETRFSFVVRRHDSSKQHKTCLAPHTVHPAAYFKSQHAIRALSNIWSDINQYATKKKKKCRLMYRV